MVTGSTSISSSRSRVPSSRLSNGTHAGSRTSIGSSGSGSSSSANQSYVNAKSSHTATASDGARTIHRKGSVPFQSITNREGSSSQDDTFRSSSSGMSSSMKQRKQSDGAGDSPYERAPGPRLSQDTGRSNSHRVPSALRRLPPAGSRVASRSVVPSGAHSSSLNAGDHSAASSSGQHPPSSSARAGVSALARANGRRSLGASLNAAGAGGAAQHERDGREITKLTVDSTSFEEWMKMATDNKINATNTWNFALIDYFHDMSLLRSDNGDGSINFQKASCTLDGCVKVWTSRVDSVVVETGKLLSGLQDDSKEANSKNRSRNDDEDDEGADMDEDTDGRGPRRKKNRAKEPTLVKSFNQLTVKKLDLEFTVDPLFKKTSADFDEGGAGGLLMNHLGVDSKARVVFDASDVPGQDDADEEDKDTSVSPPVDEEMEVLDDDDDESDSPEKARSGAMAADSQDLVDLSKLRAKLFGQHDAGNSEDALGELLNGMTVCPTFAVFKFAPNDNTLFSELTANDGPDAFNAHQSSAMPDWDMGMNDVPEYDEDGEGMFDDGNLDDAFGGIALPSGPSGAYFGADGDGFGLAEGGMDEGMEGGMGANDYGEPGEGHSAANRAPIDFTTSLQGLLDGSGGQAFQGDDFFGYFDQRMNKNWAGPEHWKMRNMTATVNGQPAGTRAPGEKGPSARKQKEPFVIDFTSAEGAVTSKELFEKPASQASTLLPNSKEPDNLYLLPEDRHFSSRQLLRLFIKPRAILNPRRTGQLLEMQGAPRSDADADFWVQAAVQRSASGTYQGEEGLALGFDAGEDGGMAAFDTQFFHEDDGGFDDAMDEVVGNAMALEPEDEELTTQALKRIRPEYVNYAKKAKQVDIRKLKENIWRELAIAVDDDDDDDQEGEESGETSGEHATPKAGSGQDAMVLDVDQSRPRKSSSKRDPTDPRAFESVLTGLRKLYSKDRMDEISTSFCFICLLHLANEEGLRIRTAPDGIGGLGMLAGRAIVEDDEEEHEESDNPQRRSSSRDVFSSRASVHDSDDGDRGRVGYLEQLSIAKDPNAGRSA